MLCSRHRPGKAPDTKDLGSRGLAFPESTCGQQGTRLPVQTLSDPAPQLASQCLPAVNRLPRRLSGTKRTQGHDRHWTSQGHFHQTHMHMNGKLCCSWENPPLPRDCLWVLPSPFLRPTGRSQQTPEKFYRTIQVFLNHLWQMHVSATSVHSCVDTGSNRREATSPSAASVHSQGRGEGAAASPSSTSVCAPGR